MKEGKERKERKRKQTEQTADRQYSTDRQTDILQLL